jgi:hypothetical protein
MDGVMWQPENAQLCTKIGITSPTNETVGVISAAVDAAYGTHPPPPASLGPLSGVLAAGLEHETASNEAKVAASESEGMADRMWSTSK